MLDGAAEAQERLERAAGIFSATLDRNPVDRDAYLAERCGDDAAMLALVRELLVNHQDETDFLEQPAIENVTSGPGGGDPSAWTALVERLAEGNPKRSRYEFLGEVARGGMGAIIKVRDRDLRRTLAMKVVLGQGDTRHEGETATAEPATIGRFLEEAQVTSQLDHPGIVPVHELGVDADGRVYFTMKLVKGEDLRAVFDRVGDPGDPQWTRTRGLSVLLRACEAMAFAHAKGVVHRDLKPANVMVGRFGETYVMDWGLARLVGEDDPRDLRLRDTSRSHSVVKTERRDEEAATPDAPLLTMDGHVVGTPAYMPPEQAEGRLEDVGPASDVYAMGAILYQLLTGRTPYVNPGARVSPRTILARVLDGPPQTITTIDPDVPAELVAICEKAMNRAPRDRYATMALLADDVRAFLEQRVVAAHEAGAWAELRHWVRRNRSLAASIAAGLVIALSAAGGIAWQQRILANERTRAAETIQAEWDTVQAVLGFQKSIFTIDAWEDGENVRAVELVDRAALSAAQFFAETPVAEAQIRKALGDTYFGLGRYEAALEQYRAAYEVRVGTWGPEAAITSDAQLDLAIAFGSVGRHEEQEENARQVYERRRSRLGAREPVTLGALQDLANALTDLGRYEEALQAQQEAFEGYFDALGASHSATLHARRVLVLKIVHAGGDLQEALTHGTEVLRLTTHSYGEDHPKTNAARYTLAHCYSALGQLTESADLFEEVYISYQTRLGEDHPNTLQALNSLSDHRDRQGRYEEAATMQEAVVERYREALGPDHPRTITAMVGLSHRMSALGRYVEAADLARDANQRRVDLLGENHAETLSSQQTLASALGDLGEYEEAAALQRRTVEILGELVGIDHPKTIRAMHNLGIRVYDLGEYEEAVDLGRRVLDWRQKNLGYEHPDTANAQFSLAVALKKTSRIDEAIKLMERVLEFRRASLGEEHHDTIRALGGLSSLYARTGRKVEAAALSGLAAELAGVVLGEDHPKTLTFLNNYANRLAALGKAEEATSMQRRVVESRRSTLGPDHPQTIHAEGNLANRLASLGLVEEAAELQLSVVARFRARLGNDHPDTMWANGNLYNRLTRIGRFEDAVTVARKVHVWSRDSYGAEHAEVLRARGRLSRGLARMDRFEAAAEFERETLDIVNRVLGEEAPESMSSRLDLGWFLAGAGHGDDAVELVRETVGRAHRILGVDDDLTLEAVAQLQDLLMQLGRVGEAERAREEFATRDGVLHPRFAIAVASSLRWRGQFEAAERALLDTAETEGPVLVEAIEQLIELYAEWGKPEMLSSARRRLAESTGDAGETEPR